jgi:hypothetical protein
MLRLVTIFLFLFIWFLSFWVKAAAELRRHAVLMMCSGVLLLLAGQGGTYLSEAD